MGTAVYMARPTMVVWLMNAVQAGSTQTSLRMGANMIPIGVEVIGGSMCKDSSYFYGKHPTKCESFLLAFRLGFVSQILAAVMALCGFLMAFCVGYKACCRNDRWGDDIEMNRV